MSPLYGSVVLLAHVAGALQGLWMAYSLGGVELSAVINIRNKGGGPRNFGELTGVNTRGSEGGSLWSAYGPGAASWSLD